MLNHANIARSTLAKLALLGAVLSLAGLATTSKASAASVSVTGASANYYTQQLNYGKQVFGSVKDTASDGYCARVYTRGWNLILGYEGWSLVGTSCGSGVISSWKDTFTVYADGFQVSVCKGTQGSGTCKSTARFSYA